MKFGNITLMAGAQIKNLRGEKLAADPALETLVAAQEAMLWYNTTEKVYKFFNGTAIVALSSGGDVDLSGLVKADGSVAMTGALELSSADQSGADAKAAVSKGHVDSLLANKLSVSGGALTANLSAGNFGISNLAAPVNPTDAARKIDIENALSGMNWKEDIDALQTDAVLQPQKVEGKRYVLTDVKNLHADFGTIEGVADNAIVQYVTDKFVVVFAPTEDRAEGAIAWNTATNQYVRFDGTAWSTFGGMASVTAGAGLSQSGNQISVDLNDAGGLGLDAEGITLKLDGATLALSASGVKVADSAIGYNQIDAAVLGTGLKRNATTSKIEVDKTAITGFGFIGAAGGSVEALEITGEMGKQDGAVATRKFVVDATAGASKVYVMDNSEETEGATTFDFQHNAGIRFGTVIVYNEAGEQIMPDSIKLIDNNNLQVVVAEAMKPFIVFIAGENQYVKPEAPVEPYSILMASGSASRWENPYSTYAILQAQDVSTVKNVVWSRNIPNMSYMQNIMGSANGLVTRIYSSSAPTFPVTGTITATITKQDDTVVVVTADVNITEMPTQLRLGVKQAASDTTAAGSSTYIMSGQSIGISLTDDLSNILRGHDGAGATNMALKSGEKITNVNWGIVPNIKNATGYTGSDIKIVRGTNPFRINIVAPTIADASISNGSSMKFVVYATVETNQGRKLLTNCEFDFLKSTSGVTTKAAYAYTQAQLDAAVLN